MRLGKILVSCLFAVAFAAPAVWAEQSPTAVIKAGTDKAMEVLHNCAAGETKVNQMRRDEILKIVKEYFDFHEMAMRSLGPQWRQLTPPKQEEFAQAFEQLIYNTYIDRVDSYTCTDEKVFYDEERVEGNYAQVKTRVTGYKSTDVPIEYRLRLKNPDGWKVYDVVVEGISLVSNYRNQFASILSKDSFDSLLKQIKDKNIANAKAAG